MTDEIICLGDSITGWNNRYGLERVRLNSQFYPAFLEKILNGEGIKNPVINAGFDGAKSEEFPTLFDEYNAMYPKSRYFVIEFGANDFYQDGFTDETGACILKYFSSVIKGVKDAGKIPIVLNNYGMASKSPIALNSCRMAFKQKEIEQITKHNDNLAAKCQEQSVHCVDLYSKISSEHLLDGVHPNEQGSRIIAQEAAKVIIEMERLRK